MFDVVLSSPGCSVRQLHLEIREISGIGEISPQALCKIGCCCFHNHDDSKIRNQAETKYQDQRTKNSVCTASAPLSPWYCHLYSSQ